MNDDPVLRALAEHNPVRTMPADEDTAEASLAELLTRFATDPGAGAHRRSIRLRPSGVRIPAWGAVGVAAGVAAALVAGVLVANEGTNAVPQHSSASSSQARRPPISSPAQRFPVADGSTPVNLVADRTTLALTSASHYILQGTELTHTAPNVTTKSITWLDEGNRRNFRSQVFSPSGVLQLDDFRFNDDGRHVVCTVNYMTHEYAEADPTQTKKPGSTYTPPPPGNDATGIADALKQGHDRVIGMDTVNGHSVLHLSNDEPAMSRQIWVDASTYLPVRMTAGGAWGGYQIDYVWIPRTPQNVTRIYQPQVPAGFVKVTHFSGS